MGLNLDPSSPSLVFSLWRLYRQYVFCLIPWLVICDEQKQNHVEVDNGGKEKRKTEKQ